MSWTPERFLAFQNDVAAIGTTGSIAVSSSFIQHPDGTRRWGFKAFVGWDKDYVLEFWLNQGGGGGMGAWVNQPMGMHLPGFREVVGLYWHHSALAEQE